MFLKEPEIAFSILPEQEPVEELEAEEEEKEEKIENAAPIFKKELGQWSYNYEKDK